MLKSNTIYCRIIVENHIKITTFIKSIFKLNEMSKNIFTVPRARFLLKAKTQKPTVQPLAICEKRSRTSLVMKLGQVSLRYVRLRLRRRSWAAASSFCITSSRNSKCRYNRYVKFKSNNLAAEFSSFVTNQVSVYRKTDFVLRVCGAQYLTSVLLSLG